MILSYLKRLQHFRHLYWGFILILLGALVWLEPQWGHIRTDEEVDGKPELNRSEVLGIVANALNDAAQAFTVAVGGRKVVCRGFCHIGC